jgi:hypothetical protein
MTPAEFLAVVLPSPGLGLYCAVELTKKKEHFYAETIDDLIPKIDAWTAASYDVFYGVAAFDTKRGADNAQFVKSFFIDMDGYATKKDAANALIKFMQDTGLAELGTPWIVDSGGGLHAYWPLDADIPAAIWRPVAENFKRLCAQFNFKIDMTVTADLARILRVPGTFNMKAKYDKPRPVRILQEGDIFNLAAFSGVVYQHVEEKYEAPEPKIDLPGQRPQRVQGAAQVNMLANSVTLFANVEPHCAQIADYKNTAAEDGKEPVWRGLLSWAKVCQDGDAKALELSAMHPYPEERMRQKMAEIKGPYPCTKMDSENPGICTGCKHWGKITNPLVLGREIKEDNTEKVIQLTPQVPDTEFDEEAEFNAEDAYEPDAPLLSSPASVTRPVPPRGYSYGENGGVYCVKSEEDEEGKKVKRNIQLVPYDLFVVDLLKMENDHLVHMAAVRPEGVQTLNFPQKSIVSKDETLKWLASQNIVSTFAGHDKILYEYVRACVGEASQNRKPISVPSQCGWQDDNSFVYNNRVFTADGRETQVPMPGLENINRNTNGRGDLSKWQKLWQTIFVNKPDMDIALALCIDSFGAPLMRFTEYEGFVWHIGSQWSGTGKSLVLSAKAGVWGHPLRYRTGKSTSPVAMQQRAGLLKSMPLLIDEITSTQRENMEWAPAFIFDYAEGQGKERMESGANKERINNSNWASTCTMTGNEKLTDYMAGARKHSSNGELLRMLEWSPHTKLIWTSEERTMLLELKRNYGVAGEAWVRWLAKNQKTVEEVVGKVHIHLKKAMNFTDDERYWHAGCTTTVAAAVLLRSEYSGILDVEVNKIIAALLKLIKTARGVMTSSVRSAEDVLNAYIGDNYGNFIVIRKVDGIVMTGWGDGDGTKDFSITRSKVLGRVEHGMATQGYREFYVEEQLMKKHCVTMSFGYDEFKAQMETLFRVTYTKKDMLARTNGPSMRVNAMHVSFKNEVFDGNKVSVGEAKEG